MLTQKTKIKSQDVGNVEFILTQEIFESFVYLGRVQIEITEKPTVMQGHKATGPIIVDNWAAKLISINCLDLSPLQ